MEDIGSALSGRLETTAGYHLQFERFLEGDMWTFRIMDREQLLAEVRLRNDLYTRADRHRAIQAMLLPLEDYLPTT